MDTEAWNAAVHGVTELDSQRAGNTSQSCQPEWEDTLLQATGGISPEARRGSQGASRAAPGTPQVLRGQGRCPKYFTNRPGATSLLPWCLTPAGFVL